MALCDVVFTTKIPSLSIPSTALAVPRSSTVKELDALLKALLHINDDSKSNNIVFDYLVCGELLRVSLDEALVAHGLSEESSIHIEFIPQQPSPEPDNSLVLNDWVSATRACGKVCVVGSYDSLVSVWNLESGAKIYSQPAHESAVRSIAILTEDDGRILFLSGSHDTRVHLWSWSSAAFSRVASFEGHIASVDALAASKDKTRFVSGSYDKTLRIWTADEELMQSRRGSVGGDDGEVSDSSSPQSSDNGRSSRGDSPRPTKRQRIAEKKHHAAVAADTSEDSLVCLRGHGEAVTSVDWTDEHILSSSFDHTLRLWDAERAESARTLNGSKAFLSCSRFAGQPSQIIASSCDPHIRLFDSRVDASASLVQQSFSGHTGWVSSVACSSQHDHLFYSGSYDRTTRLWDMRSPKAALFVLRGHEGNVLAVDWSNPLFLLSGAADERLNVHSFTDPVCSVDSSKAN